MDHPAQAGYYQRQQKQVSSQQNGAPERLENLEPDSEVELIPGAQQPQQPPQQNPVAPNIPGLIPGQRVFIVHMPIPGYSPGTVGGYQPVYIVAAAPQGNAGYPGNGYQNGGLDPAQALYPAQVAPLYPGQGVGALYPGQGSLLYRTPLLTRPYELYPQDPNVLGYGPAQAGQIVGVPVAQSPAAAKQVEAANTNPKNAQLREPKDGQEERHNARPAPQHRNKA